VRKPSKETEGLLRFNSFELIEELVLAGGGIGLFQGCAAGDSSLACVLEVAGR
jgi:hypothetical protein